MQPVNALIVSIIAKGEPKIVRYAEVGTGNHRNVGFVEDVPRQFLRGRKPLHLVPFFAA